MRLPTIRGFLTRKRCLYCGLRQVRETVTNSQVANSVSKDCDKTGSESQKEKFQDKMNLPHFYATRKKKTLNKLQYALLEEHDLEKKNRA